LKSPTASLPHHERLGWPSPAKPASVRGLVGLRWGAQRSPSKSKIIGFLERRLLRWGSLGILAKAVAWTVHARRGGELGAASPGAEPCAATVSVLVRPRAGGGPPSSRLPDSPIHPHASQSPIQTRFGRAFLGRVSALRFPIQTHFGWASRAECMSPVNVMLCSTFVSFLARVEPICLTVGPVHVGCQQQPIIGQRRFNLEFLKLNRPRLPRISCCPSGAPLELGYSRAELGRGVQSES